MTGTARHGFVYSVFAIAIIGLTLNIVVFNVGDELEDQRGERLRIDEAFYFLLSIEDDLDRATDIVGRRAVTALTNRIIDTGEFYDEAEPPYREAFVNGTINGTVAPLMNRSTIRNWSRKMQNEADDAGFRLNLTFVSMEAGKWDTMHIALNTTYHLNLTDPVTRSSFDRVERVRGPVSFRGTEDPLILIESAGRYTNFYANCSTAAPARQHGTGSTRFYDSQPNWTSGTAVTRPANGPVSGVSDRGEKIAVVDDVCSYSPSTLTNDFTDFAGVVTESEAIDQVNANSVDICGNSSVSMNAVIDGADGATNITNGTMAVMDGYGAWQNNLKAWTEQGCYFKDPWAPWFWDRLEGRLVHGPGVDSGLAFLLTVPDLPSELQKANTSAVGYVYFNESGDYGDTHKIKGVTNEDMSWFRLDQEHIDHWGINALSYD